MKQPYENIIKTEIISIVAALLLGAIAVIKGYKILIFICLFLLTLSLFCEATMAWFMDKKSDAGKQFMRAIMLLVLTFYLLLSS